ncbi:hypothetical protein SO802_005776 [Lithocarpus litseifolius]|uniref:Reverse transcriptase zinc-binding domain-containing protein n=1 Tax=Lithocarpus litseifolius TaxID=425828 RepID=A0AAW2DJ39_9ROSI
MCTPKKDGGLGFRDLKTFNLALLSKQGCRIYTNTHSLVHRVFKARYFMNGDFLHAELGRQPSYAWRSIMAAKHIVHAGHRWQVGDGTTVRIWKDRWIPKPSTFCPISQQNTLPLESTISELIDEDTGEWNATLIKQIFIPDEARTILSMPRSHRRANDRIIWAYTPKGNFTVNSAYKVAWAISPSVAMDEVSNPYAKRQFWRTIWNLDIPNKLKTFTWKACRDILPTKSNLCHRGVLDNATCETCGLTAEISGHLFWDCIGAREVWTATGIAFDTNGVHFSEFVDFLWYLLFVQRMDLKLIELTITVAWCMWYNRNKTRLGSPRQTSHEIIHKARSILEDFQLAHLARPCLKDQTDARWSPPSHPWYKVNTDAAVFSNLQTIGIGVIIRDHEGSVIATLSQHLLLPLGPLEAETKALDVAASFAWDMGIRDVVFETDSKVVSDALCGTINPQVSIEDVI